MPTLTLSRKIEKILTLYMQAELSEDALTIYEGHSKAPAPVFPELVVYAEDSQPHPEMPTSTGVRVVKMRLEIRVDSEDDGEGNPRDLLDGWREDIERVFSDVAGVVDFIDTEPDGINDIHVYDIIPEAEPSEFDKTDWIEQIVFGVVCQQIIPLD